MGIDEDDILNKLKELVEKGDTIVRVPNEEKVALVKRLYEITKNITSDADVKLRLFEPFSNMGAISIEGKKPLIEDTGLFAEIAKYASNFNVYARLDGRVHIDFTFYGLTVPVGKGK